MNNITNPWLGCQDAIIMYNDAVVSFNFQMNVAMVLVLLLTFIILFQTNTWKEFLKKLKENMKSEDVP